MSTTKETTYSMDREKAIVVYLYLAQKYKGNTSKIQFSKFEQAWNDMFVPFLRRLGQEQQKKLLGKQKAEFRFVCDKFAEMPLDEVKEYRKQFQIYDGTTIPYELKQLAIAKGVFVALASDPDTHLSGFDITVKDNRTKQIYSLLQVPYTLTESEARQKLESLPTKAELKAREQTLMNLLESDEPVEKKEKAVSRYKEPYATHNFKKFMNTYTIHQCKNKQLTLLCVQLCQRVGIKNLSNNRTIEYCYCEGSGKREKTIRRSKRGGKRRKKSA